MRLETSTVAFQVT